MNWIAINIGEFTPLVGEVEGGIYRSPFISRYNRTMKNYRVTIANGGIAPSISKEIVTGIYGYLVIEGIHTAAGILNRNCVYASTNNHWVSRLGKSRTGGCVSIIPLKFQVSKLAITSCGIPDVYSSGITGWFYST